MKKILLIEDDDILRENTAEILRLAQYEVITANNGKDGSQLALEHYPDLIICDILMPNLDGFGVIYVLSKNNKTSSIPFIFISAKTQSLDIRKGMELGADDYLCKPFDDNQLLAAVETRLNKRAMFSIRNDQQTLFKSKQGGDEINKFHKYLQKKNISFYKKKQVVYYDTDTPEYLYFVKEGRLKAFKTHFDGKEYITRIYTGGDIFGYTAIFSSSEYSDSVVALEASSVYKISKNDFFEFLSFNGVLLNYFIRLLSGDISTQENKLLNLAYNSVRTRTAQALLLLHESIDDKCKDKGIIIARDDLASLTGTAVETVIRCLGEFKDDGLIITDNKVIFIKDKVTLTSI
jgi:DNA-binding response OmpR family regulator